MEASSAPPQGEAVYQIKISLMYTDPLIWRRVLVPNTVTLQALHDIIQRSMGWNDSHPHEFEIQKKSYKKRLFESPFPGDFDDSHAGSDADFKLYQVIKINGGKKFKFLYNYDFGDNWEHEILVEKVLPREEGLQYPICTDGKLACPPDDSGGTCGYYGLLEAMENPTDPDSVYFLDFLSRVFEGTFDPNKFDVATVNEKLRALP